MKTTSASILIVEDHQDLAANIGDYLEVGGFQVDFAAEGLSAIGLCESNHYDLIVLDIMMPGMNGFEVCRKLRQELHSDVPVIMLTARDTLDDKLTGFDHGADDYLVKPFEMKELEARIVSLIRRHRGDLETSTLSVADLKFDLQAMRVTRGDKVIKLSPITLHILRILMRESPKLVSRERIETEVWGDEAPDSDTLRSHLYNLRKSIDKPFQESLMHTIPGVGYKLCRAEDV